MAGALSRRDIEMVFRAETDKATRPIATLTKDVKSLRSALEGQIEAVKRGEASLDSLADTTRDLQKAQDELGTNRALLTQLNSQVKALDSAETKLSSATAKYDALATKIAETDKPTKTLQKSFEAATRAQAGAAESLDKVRQETADTRAQIEAIIGPVDSISEAFREVAVASRDIGRGMAVTGTAAKELAGDLRTVADANAKLNADKAFQKAGQDAGLLQAQITYLSEFENRIELLAQAKRDLVAEDAAFAKALTAQEAKVGAANVAQLRAAFEATAETEARLNNISAFRKIASDAKASLLDVQRFGMAEDTAAASTTRFAAAIEMLTNPAAAARKNLAGIESTVTLAGEAMEHGRKSSQTLSESLNSLSSAIAGINAVAKDIEAFRMQEAAVEKASKAFEAARADALALANALKEAEAPTAEMAADLKRAETAANALGNEMQREGEKLKVVGGRLREAGVNTSELTTEMGRLTRAAKLAGDTQTAIQGKLGGKGGMFGLSVQDATNLSYQFNDIFTQLASGQSIFITLAQQGPQIWQIEGVKSYISALGPLLPVLGAVAVGIGLVAAVIGRANNEMMATRTAAADIAIAGQAGSLTAQQIGKASIAMQDYGASAEDARKSLNNFSTNGLNPAYLDQMVAAARDAARATGGDLADAFTLLTNAMAGGQAGIDALLDKFPILSEVERAHINDMIQHGREDEARTIIFQRFVSTMDDAEKKMRSPWKDATDNLAQAWRNFADSTWVRNFVNQAIEDLGRLAAAAQWVTSLLPGGNKGPAVAAPPKTAKQQMADRVDPRNLAMNGLAMLFGSKERKPVAAPPPKKPPPKTGNPGGRDRPTATGRDAVRDALLEAQATQTVNRALQEKARLQQAEIAARRKATQGNQAQRNNQVALGVQAEQAKIDDENRKKAEQERKKGETAANKSRSAANKLENEAEARAAKIASEVEQLQAALDTMGAKVGRIAAGSMEDQIKAARGAVDTEYAKLFRRLDEFSKLTGGAGKIGGKSIGEYRDQIKANEVILANQAELKVREDTINATLAERKSLLAEIEEKRDRGAISASQSIKDTAEVTSRFAPIIDGLVDAAVKFAASISGAVPSPELKAFVSKVQTIGAKTGGANNEDSRKQAQTAVAAEEGKLNKIVSERNALVESYNALQQVGIITSSRARELAAAAYNASKDEIAAQILKVQETLQTGQQYFDPMVYDAMIAKLQEVGAQAEYIDPRFAQLKSSIDGLLTQNAMAGIDKVIAALGGMATGATSVAAGFKQAGLAVLDFIGQTIGMIAKLILQMIILSAFEKITGIPVGALLRLQDGGAKGVVKGGPAGSIAKTGGAHGGGTIGELGGWSTNRVSLKPGMLNALPRYHEGTPAVGLKRDEQLSVLKVGEKVMTEEQQRRESGGSTGGGKTPLRQVLAFGDSEVAAAMAGPAGEDVTITHLRRNIPILKQFLGSE